MLIELELDKTTCVLSNLNTRTEKAGKIDVPAADLHVTLNVSADVLATFSPTLKSHLFKKDKDLAGEILTLAHPEIAYPLEVGGEMANAEVKIGHGVNGKPMEFAEAKINQFRVTPLEGGTVTLAFRVQCKPDEKQIAKLYMLQKQAIEVTVIPGELPEMKAAA